MQMLAQGLLTLEAGKAIQQADVKQNVTQIYYAPFNGAHIRVFDGDDFRHRQFTSNALDQVGLALTLDANSSHVGYHQVDKIFDAFVVANDDTGAVAKLCTGVTPWVNDTTPGIALELHNGGWANRDEIQLRYGPNQNDLITVGPYQAIHVGGFRATLAGATSMEIRPARAVGGCNNKLAVWNRYNRQPIEALSQDDVVSYNCNATVAQPANYNQGGAGTNLKNRIWWLDMDAQSPVYAKFHATIETIGANGAYACGVAFNNIIQMGVCIITQAAIPNATNAGQLAQGWDVARPMRGWNYAQALESANATPGVKVDCRGNSGLLLRVPM